MINQMRNYVALILTIVTVIAYLILHYLIGHNNAKYLIDAATLGVGIIIVWTWLSAVLDGFKRGFQSGASKVIVTIWLTWLVLVIQRVYALAFTAAHSPMGWTMSAIPGEITTLLFVSGMYAIIAPVQENNIPKQQLTHLLIAAVIGGMVAGMVLGYYVATNAPDNIPSLFQQ